MIARIRKMFLACFRGFATKLLRFLYRNGLMKCGLDSESVFLKEELSRLLIENAALKVAIEELQLRTRKSAPRSTSPADEDHSTGSPSESPQERAHPIHERQ